MQKYTKQLPSTQIRFEPELLEWLKWRANANYRSLTGEVNFLLAGIKDAEGNASLVGYPEGAHDDIK